MTTVVDVIPQRDARQWAALIRADLGQAVAGFIAAGQHLRDAKVQIPHGGWEKWVKEQVGISPRTAQMMMELARHPALTNPQHASHLPPSWYTLYELSQLDPPWLEAAIGAGRVTPELERKQARALVIEYKQIAAEVSFRVEHGDFRKLSELVEPGSLDAVITDPPYPAEHLPLWSDLAKHAAAWLRPGGLCAVMSGQTHLPDVIARMSKHLSYQWTVAYLTPGGQAVQIFPRRVNTFWKPILIYRNGPCEDSAWFGDVANSKTNDNDKRFHHWGQSESGMADLIKRLTEPAQTILDPFMGAGTTGVAALALGRSFIGCDVNADHVDSARDRLEQTVLDRFGTG